MCRARKVLSSGDFNEINLASATRLSVPRMPDMKRKWTASADPRTYSGDFDVLGVAVHARRSGDRVITYSYDSSDIVPPLNELFKLFRKENERMREQRATNVRQEPGWSVSSLIRG